MNKLLKNAKRVPLSEWFYKLALNVLPYEVYLKYSNPEIAYLILHYWKNSQPRSWGWSWGKLKKLIFKKKNKNKKK
jgi:hypothetical protein